MEKRVVIAIGLCIGVLILWTQLFPPPKPPAPAAAPPGQTAPATAPVAQPSGAPAGPGGAGAPPIVNRPERQLELSTPEVRFVFSSLGGTLLHAKLRERQFLDRSADPASVYDVVRTLDSK